MLLRIFIALMLLTPALRASRVKDMSFVSGARSNQLIGYGIVVGLAGDGDSNAVTTLRSVANILQRNGLTVDPTQIKAKNSAAVMITADISAFLKPGARIDVTVASMGDAKSLQGGVLLQAPLMGADGRVYAVAHHAGQDRRDGPRRRKDGGVPHRAREIDAQMREDQGEAKGAAWTQSLWFAAPVWGAALLDAATKLRG